jgi:hypothetical protein
MAVAQFGSQRGSDGFGVFYLVFTPSGAIRKILALFRKHLSASPQLD